MRNSCSVVFLVLALLTVGADHAMAQGGHSTTIVIKGNPVGQPTVVGADNTEVSSLTIEHTGRTGQIAGLETTGSMRVSDARIIAAGASAAGASFALSVVGGYLVVHDVETQVDTVATTSFAASVATTDGATVDITDSTLQARNTGSITLNFSIGLLATHPGDAIFLRDSIIDSTEAAIETRESTVAKVLDTQLIGNLVGAGVRTCRGAYDANLADVACSSGP